MRTELLCIGTELLYGKINTHIAYIGSHLSSIGLPLTSAITVSDELDEMKNVFKESIDRSDIIFITGGIGPTFDDLTREATAFALNKKLVFSAEILEQINNFFKTRNVKISPKGNERQAYLIENAVPIFNKIGTAPGQIIEHKEKLIIILPGPPTEMHAMFEESVLSLLKKKYVHAITRSKTLHIYGLSESKVNEMILPIVETERRLEGGSVSFTILAHLQIVDIKITATGTNELIIDELIHNIKAEFYQLLKKNIFSEDHKTLEGVTAELFMKKKKTLSTAESCTGGLISNRITNLAGSSLFFKGGVVAYSNDLKTGILKVKQKTLNDFGAVSEQTVLEMAEGIKTISESDYAVAVSGITGPAGGSKEKPIGTVCFGLITPKGNKLFTEHFYGSRTEIKEKAANFIFNLIRLELSK
ncbi:MAG: hypothetical protein A2252_08825 [Elusimicrobia bacterium RIFOXYA2_FULL_39_19]|nr:MAG: hypothetical protein A2252_08825 [Elusimicrobia bacterium RIFOXYA2_FULL_39_19]